MLKNFVLLILFFQSVAWGNNKTPKLDLITVKKDDSSLQEVIVFNGKAKVLKYTVDKPDSSLEILCDNKKMPFRLLDNQLEIILFADYYSQDRVFYCEANTAKLKLKILKVQVKQFAYKETELTVQPGKVFLSAKDQKRVAREQKILNSVYAKRSPQLLYSSPFMIPLSSERTSIYGDKRIFNKKHPSTHLGNDFRAPVGTEIPTANDGEIVYVGDLFYSGKTVIIDHGMQLFSMYAHLSEIKAKVGSKVTKGEVIGLSGATGRASGPHLHWGIKIHGDWIDGFSLVEEYNTITLLSENESNTKM
jgi:murein DD-endopeptidase MepM/ murein hydrolase activator NlpD